MFEWLWLRLRGLGRFLATAFSVSLRPRRFAERIVINDKTNYFRALTYFITALGLGVAIEALFSYIFKTYVDEFLYQLFVLFGWIINGFFIYLVLRLLRVRDMTSSNVYHCYAYSVGTGFFVVTASLAVVVAVPFVTHFAQVRSTLCQPRLVECVLKEIGAAQIVQPLAAVLMICLAIYFAWVFAIFISRTLGTPKWRPFLAVFIGGTIGNVVFTRIAQAIVPIIQGGGQ